ncbi:hypothetical protein [Paenibacillus odorifer]|uniref:hypothetical protein n=1 Tax=Paenibacillus odorifer TaxID=189426 RepID=UPI0021164FBC|nr:hypothetical protein [Paenibacillus odorifer]
MAEVQALINPLLPVEVEGFFALLFGYIGVYATFYGIYTVLFSYLSQFHDFCGIYTVLFSPATYSLNSTGFTT